MNHHMIKNILKKEIEKLTKEIKIKVDFEQRLIENENVREVIYGSGEGSLTEKKTEKMYQYPRVLDRNYKKNLYL
jgi:hypothetical protein